jgi:hypothetical protein
LTSTRTTAFVELNVCDVGDTRDVWLHDATVLWFVRVGTSILTLPSAFGCGTAVRRYVWHGWLDDVAYLILAFAFVDCEHSCGTLLPSDRLTDSIERRRFELQTRDSVDVRVAAFAGLRLTGGGVAAAALAIRLTCQAAAFCLRCGTVCARLYEPIFALRFE